MRLWRGLQSFSKVRLRTFFCETWPFFCFKEDTVTLNYNITGFLRLYIGPLLLSILLLAPPQTAQAQSGLTDAIAGCLKAGDASGISRYFGSSVDITINSSTSTYSRTQGELVLRDFFSKNTVHDFTVNHSGNSSDRPATFTIGNLQTDNGRYRVYMWLKPRDGGYVLKEIRFEK